MAFEQYKVENIRDMLIEVLTGHTTLKQQTQELLKAIAADIELDGNCSSLTQLVTDLSGDKRDKNGGLMLSVVASSVGFYMRKHLPIKWVRKENKFVMADDWAGCDVENYEDSLAIFESVNYDDYNPQKADQVFNVEKRFNGAVAMLKKVVREGKAQYGELDPEYRTVREAEKMLKAINQEVEVSTPALLQDQAA